MNLPYFHIQDFDPPQSMLMLDENNSRHIVQVLRMQQGALLHLTDGKGHLLTATIMDAHKKHCTVDIKASVSVKKTEPEITVAISPVKNANRFEWFLEKATEIGINRIVPLICERTEKEKTKSERLQNILISAMLQSRQAWLPQLESPAKFADFIKQPFKGQQFIAHCVDADKQFLKSNGNNALILIGPEGDFTPPEIEAALEQGFLPVSLGSTRLRTETAGFAAAILLRMR